jgi:negative regulator of flagellin synthesis FlgM
MQITPKNQANAIDAYNSAQVQSRQKTGSEEGKVSGQQGPKADTVVISDAAKRIQEAQTQIQAIPDVRADKVAELRARIENGTYEIKPEKIADKMIRESLLNDLFK